jgi:CheY-like chemotaxis protein
MPDQLPNVLVVDDDQSIVELAVEALNRFGLHRPNHSGGAIGLNATPSLQVLCPTFASKQARGRISFDVSCGNGPAKVVFMTGGYDNISSAAVDPVLRKPFDLIRLRKTIDGIYNRAELHLRKSKASDDGAI